MRGTGDERPATVPAMALATTNPAGTGWFGVVVLLVVAVGTVVLDPGLGAVRVALGSLLAALVVWANLVRPVLLVRGDRLELVNPVSTVSLPMFRVDRVLVRAVTVVWIGERRYTSTAVGRKIRAMARPERYGVDDPVPDQVEEQLRGMVEAARRGRLRHSDSTIRTSRDWHVLAPMIGLGAALAVSFVF